MASVNIRLKKDIVLSDDTYAITIQVLHNRKKKVFHLGHSAKLNQWDEKNNRPNSKHPDHKIIKSRIRNDIIFLKTIITDFENKHQHFSLADIEKKFKKSLSSIYFDDYVTDIIDKMVKEGKNGNSKVYYFTKNTFNTFLKNKSIKLTEIDYKTIKAFESYLVKKGNKINSISVHLRTLRAIINRAIKEDLVEETSYPFKNISIKSEKTRKRAVNKDIIKMVEELDISKGEDLQFYRDLFMFSFYNRGMSFVDMAYLKVNNIENGRINYTRRKTGQHFSIKITDKAKAIIERYNDLKVPEAFIFPIIYRKGKEHQDYRNALSIMNKKLKEISKLLKLDVPLSSYVSRHSWATIAKRAGIATAVISEGLGHESEETTQVYLDSFENDVLDDANELIIN